MLAGLLRSLDGDEIAVGVGDDAEAALQLGEILIVMAKNQRSVAIVVEREVDLDIVALALRALHLGPCERDGTIGWFQTRIPRGVWTGSGERGGEASRPNRELEPVATISTATTDADEAGVAIELHGLEIAALASDLAGVAAVLFDQHIERAADHRAVERLTLAFEQRLQPGEARDLDLLLDLIDAVGAGVPGAANI